MTSIEPDEADIPNGVRVHLAHAYLAWLAKTYGVDLLHIKGPASDPRWQGFPASTDADVLVRPVHMPLFEQVLRSSGWQQKTEFADASAWQHAAVWHHPSWGYADLHRRWPGFGVSPDTAFERLWATRGRETVAHQQTVVPGHAEQFLVHALHEARSGHSRQSGHKLREEWDSMTAEERSGTEGLAATLEAEVGLAAFLGRLGDFRGHPEHDLWLYFSMGQDNRAREWWARLRSARNTAELVAVIASAWRVGRVAPGGALREDPRGLSHLSAQVHRLWRLLRGGGVTG